MLALSGCKFKISWAREHLLGRGRPVHFLFSISFIRLSLGCCCPPAAAFWSPGFPYRRFLRRRGIWRGSLLQNFGSRARPTERSDRVGSLVTRHCGEVESRGEFGRTVRKSEGCSLSGAERGAWPF